MTGRSSVNLCPKLRGLLHESPSSWSWLPSPHFWQHGCPRSQLKLSQAVPLAPQCRHGRSRGRRGFGSRSAASIGRVLEVEVVGDCADGVERRHVGQVLKVAGVAVTASAVAAALDVIPVRS